MPATDTIREFAIEAARLLADRRFDDVRLMDVRGLSQVCEYVLVGSGTSDRQMKSVAAELEDLGEERDNRMFRSSRDEGGTWIVIDFVEVVTHLFEPNTRAYYDLETLWADAQTVDWRRPNGAAGASPASAPGRSSAPARRSRKPEEDA
jgi:ribosome-associated protein